MSERGGCRADSFGSTSSFGEVYPQRKLLGRESTRDDFKDDNLYYNVENWANITSS